MVAMSGNLDCDRATAKRCNGRKYSCDKRCPRHFASAYLTIATLNEAYKIAALNSRYNRQSEVPTTPFRQRRREHRRQDL